MTVRRGICAFLYCIVVCPVSQFYIAKTGQYFNVQAAIFNLRMLVEHTISKCHTFSTLLLSPCSQVPCPQCVNKNVCMRLCVRVRVCAYMCVQLVVPLSVLSFV